MHDAVLVPDGDVAFALRLRAHATLMSTTPASTTIAESNIGHFRLTGAAAGNDIITASATGHISASSPVTVGLGRVDNMPGWPTLLASPTDSVLVTMYPRAPDGTGRQVAAATTFAVASSSGNLRIVSGGANSVTVTSVTIPADASFVQFYLKGASAGTGTLTFTNANYQTFITPAVTVNP